MIKPTSASVTDVQCICGYLQRSSERPVPEKDDNPPSTRHFRTLIYAELSDTADVHMTAYSSNQLHITYYGKHLG